MNGFTKIKMHSGYDQGVFVLSYQKNNINYLPQYMDKRLRMRYIRVNI
ncbi:hypothetical protein D1AOALGA4SA_8891, partial [Olavius algarvensis Delta 1 endosymbiont]